MPLYDDYRNTDYLDDVSFIAGTEFTLNFPVYDVLNNPIGLNGCSMKWGLSLYGQPDVLILQKTATVSGSYTFVVSLEEADTIGLGDVYLQQAMITDIDGRVFRPAQGVVIIRKAIPIT